MRYKVVCKHYLVDEMILWGQRELKKRFPFPYPPAVARMGETGICFPTDVVSYMYRSCEEAFENQACCGNIITTNFCLKRVFPLLRQDLIFKAAKLIVDPDDDVFYLLLSNLEADKQIEILRSQTMLLTQFLSWPFTKHIFKDITTCF